MADLLFELRCEELPPRDLAEAAKSLAEALAKELGAVGLAPQATSSAWTPRRIAVWAHGLTERTPDREERLVGPKLKAAFDAEGKPTKAAEGFAKKAGVTVELLSKDAETVFATKKTPGRGAAEIVAEVLPKLPAHVKWKKTMTWGGPVRFARPIRGVVALLGGDVVACKVAGLDAGRVTRGHPFLAPAEVTLTTASKDDYVGGLRKVYVLADFAERREAVLASARKLVNGLEVRDALLDEVTNLVEWPTCLVGTFDARFKELPPKLLVTVMEHHQRFFPVRDADGSLSNRFVATMDRETDSVDVARSGFQRVLVPRLHDASFFVAEDRKTPLESRAERLNDVTYHRKLGSVGDKGRRLQEIAPRIAQALAQGRDKADFDAAMTVQNAYIAARLAKCDLVTLLVGEFPELQGHVGAVYAQAEGAHPEVCAALDAQYLHDFDGVTLTGAPLVLVLAENLDVLCQFGTKVGLPSGSNDPFGVRRAAITLLDACERFAPTLPLLPTIMLAGGDGTIFEYLDTRLRQRLRDEGFRHDHIDAVTSWTSVGEIRARLADLKSLSGDASFARLLEVAERCRNITKKADASPAEVKPELLQEPAEQALYEVWNPVREKLPKAPAPLTRQDVATIAAAIAGPLHQFFADVFVNADDLAVRGNRLALLRQIDAELLRFADLCRIQKS